MYSGMNGSCPDSDVPLLTLGELELFGRFPASIILLPPVDPTGYPEPAVRTYLPDVTASHLPWVSLGSDDVCVTMTHPTGYMRSNELSSIL